MLSVRALTVPLPVMEKPDTVLKVFGTTVIFTVAVVLWPAQSPVPVMLMVLAVAVVCRIVGVPLISPALFKLRPVGRSDEEYVGP